MKVRRAGLTLMEVVVVIASVAVTPDTRLGHLSALSSSIRPGGGARPEA